MRWPIVAASGYAMRVFIWSATTGAAASPGALPTAIMNGWLPSPFSPARHPNAFNRALQTTDAEQAKRSRHHKAFLEPDAADLVLADNARWLRDRLAANGVPAAAIEAHLSVLGNKDAMEAALAWYRARGAIRGPLGPIRVPTLYVWGDADDTVGRIAAEGTVDFIAAPYRFEVLPGVGHFAADQAPDRVCELLLEHLADHPV
jgi:pimeloyl-ACP methyl ester carboxylesterase